MATSSSPRNARVDPRIVLYTSINPLFGKVYCVDVEDGVNENVDLVDVMSTHGIEFLTDGESFGCQVKDMPASLTMLPIDYALFPPSEADAFVFQHHGRSVVVLTSSPGAPCQVYLGRVVVPGTMAEA